MNRPLGRRTVLGMGQPVPPQLERVVRNVAIATWLSYSKYDLNDRLRFFKLSRCQREGHINKFMIASVNFIRQTCRAELNQLQFEMTDVLLIVRLDIAPAVIEALKLTLNQHVGC